MNRDRALRTFRRQPTDRIAHYEHFSNPDAVQLITGIDPWEKPHSAYKAFVQRYALDVMGFPAEDKPIPRVSEGEVTFEESDGRKTARWGHGKSWNWDWGSRFKTIEDVIAYQPLENLDNRWMEPVGLDFSISVDDLAVQFQNGIDGARKLLGDISLACAGFYNTLFMWPLLTFGWELFLELGAAYQDECKRLLRDFACLSRKVFQAWAKTDVEVFTSHDDICYQGGPVFSPKWLREMIYPYYEEFWRYLKDAGKVVAFVCDGNIDAVADDVLACGADGWISEPYTNWRELARKHPNAVIAGDGDNRVLMTNDREAIYAMVREMAEFGRGLPGYFFCCGNHIPWNIAAESVKWYFDAAEQLGSRV